MTRLIVDSTLPSRLADVVAPVELCDHEGRILGHYYPTPDPKKFLFDIGPLKSGSDYEIQVKASDGSLSNVAFTRFKKA